MSVKRRVSWMLRGQQQTDAALTSIGDDLRALQVRVDGLQASLSELQVAQRTTSSRQLDELDRIRAAVVAATDDLTARVQAVSDARSTT